MQEQSDNTSTDSQADLAALSPSMDPSVPPSSSGSVGSDRSSPTGTEAVADSAGGGSSTPHDDDVVPAAAGVLVQADPATDPAGYLLPLLLLLDLLQPLDRLLLSHRCVQ
jgi:hypothetical protein